MKRSAVIASLLGCRNLVIHPIMPCGLEDMENGKEQETWDMNIAFFRALVDFSRQYGVTVCLENMPFPHFSISTPEKILEFVRSFDDEYLKICLDTGHVAVFSDLSVGEEIRRLGNYIAVLHVHDNMGDGDNHRYPTKGKIDWADVARALDDIGYNGVFSLETAPSSNLNDEQFEKESIALFQIAKTIVSKK